MAIDQLSVTEAHDKLNGSTDASYVDVRTEAEFNRGHPTGARNIPVVFLEAGKPATPNPDFVDVVSANFAKDAELIMGCQAGGRSQRACDLLAAAGFTNLTNVKGGYGGARDRSGNVVAQGWVDAGLPTEQACGAGNAYADLKGK